MSEPVLGSLLGSGKEAEVFECEQVVAKLYRSSAPKRSAFREAAILAMVESLGLPVPSVLGVLQIGGRWGVMMTRAQGPSFANAMREKPSLAAEFLNGMALLQSQVHSHPATHLASLKARLAANIRQARMLGKKRQTSLLARLSRLPEGDCLCHGDFHPQNILGPLGQEVLIDWLDASRGDPAADVCRSYVLIRHSDPRLASEYVDAYAGVGKADRRRILSWLPAVAGARLAEGVPDEVDELMEMVDFA